MILSTIPSFNEKDDCVIDLIPNFRTIKLTKILARTIISILTIMNFLFVEISA
jgi:hypothetical protein